jgi:hypothetical protein
MLDVQTSEMDAKLAWDFEGLSFVTGDQIILV